MRVRCMCMFLVLFINTQRLSLGFSSEEIPVCDDSTNTTKSCCPCYQETILNCNMTCPDGYLSVYTSASSVTCKTNSISTPSVTMTTAASVTTETENSTLTSENVTKSVFSSDEEYVIVCQVSCEEHQWYNNETKQCLNCDEKCLKCNMADVCTVCRYLNNETCYAKCPPGMVESNNKTADGSKLCELKKPGETAKTNLAVIIGAAAGGGAVLIIVVVVIVCCCCRHHRNNQNIAGNSSGRTAMSVLLEKQQADNERGTNKKPSGRPAGYENMSQTLPTKTAVERGADNVLRYTKDPTSQEKSNQDEEDKEKESDYGNAAMVRLMKNVPDLSHRKREDVQEMLELEMMGEAPRAPTPLPVSTGRNKGKEKGVPLPQTHVPEDYVDMSGRPDTSAAVSERNTADIDTGPASGLEDYENVDYQRIPQGRQARNITGETATGAQADKTKGDSSDLEDYENTKDLRITGNKGPKGSGKPREDDDENLEDYENMKDLELYENTQFPKK